ncbi:MAG: formylglycine-generating enzyme family protein [Treponema sp.]|nr:formylglycine-generating enzyme family protein [Treponema sp.]
MLILGYSSCIKANVPDGFVRINGGTFTMGSPADEPQRGGSDGYMDGGREGPQRKIKISSFYMGKCEVTVGEFRRFVNASGYETEAEKYSGTFVSDIGYGQWRKKAEVNWKNPHYDQDESHPVASVTWNDAVQYCNWLSEQEGLTLAYNIDGKNVIWNRKANGYRLPTEAEWEYACRAGTTTPFSTGSNITTDQANYNGYYPYNDNARGEWRERTMPVGSFEPNPWGIYDMHGNVWELCWDWYEKYPSEDQKDPQGPDSGSNRVVRGGSWNYNGRDVRSANRNSVSPSTPWFGLGFRVARSLL